MNGPVVLVLESSQRLANLLRRRCPARLWVISQCRNLEDVKEALSPGRSAVVIAEAQDRFLDAIVWILEHRPQARVMAVTAAAVSNWRLALLDVGAVCCLARPDVFDCLPDLVSRACLVMTGGDRGVLL